MCCTVAVILLPLTSDRLTIQMMRQEHAATLVAYRNDPDVARFQDWAIPFTDEMADQLIGEQAGLDGPANGTWVQLAVAHDGTTIGDVAVGIYDEGRQAMIGYSISPAEQGNGYATEAVTAVLDALFRAPGMHRVSATIDPANLASRRVLEKLGFRHEGHAVRSVSVRGEWVDDDSFAVLASEWPQSIRRGDPA